MSAEMAKENTYFPDYLISSLTDSYSLKFIKGNSTHSDLDSIDDLLLSKVDDFEGRKKALLEFIEERKSLERRILSKLEDIISECKVQVPQFPNNPQQSKLKFQWQKVMIECEHKIFEELINSFHDRLNLEKELWILKTQSQNAKRQYRLFRDL